MPFSRTPFRRVLKSLPGPVLAVLALISQLAIGGMVLPDDAAAARQSAALDAAFVMCRSGASKPAGPGAPHRHHLPDRAVCPLGVALALPAAVLSTDPAMPSPAIGIAIHRLRIATARGPPAPIRPTPYPRGPPILA